MSANEIHLKFRNKRKKREKYNINISRVDIVSMTFFPFNGHLSIELESQFAFGCSFVKIYVKKIESSAKMSVTMRVSTDQTSTVQMFFLFTLERREKKKETKSNN